MQRVLITGANKGIGLAAVEAVLAQDDQTAVLLGSRSPERGQAALDGLCQQHPEWQGRVQLLQLDVADTDSVAIAQQAVQAMYPDEITPLYGVVNNAGIGFGSTDMGMVLNVNVMGPKRICDAFLPMVATGGRIVNVSSAAAPNFIEQCEPSRQRFFLDAELDWSDIQQLLSEVADLDNDVGKFSALGLGSVNAYGLSKACLSMLTMILARQNPDLLINACTPGFIDTDLTRSFTANQGLSAAELGMKPPQAGTVAIMFLLFGQPHGSGDYYGSDAKRSPMDRYRAPGEPEYTGD